uniref:Ubiquitin-like protease family profile domain-containing protein n=1 Tax=Oryza punctata TaxID=4537 RepID=A0A0E0LW18_ORYPU
MSCSEVQSSDIEVRPLKRAKDSGFYQDYDMTDDDICAQITIETLSSTDVLVKINDITLKQNQLLPLLDENEYLDDNIVGAYIYCIRDQAQFETPLISGLLKRDGKLGIAENNDVHSNFITKIARVYLTHELTDGASCGLFMLKYMEHWTGDTLSHPITQEHMTLFRSKLASILIRWKTNTAQTTPKSEQSDVIGDNSDCVKIFSSMDNKKRNSHNIIDFGRHPDYRKKLNIEKLVESVCNGHGIDYNISKCKLVDCYTNIILWYLRSYHIGSRNQNFIYIRPNSA